MGKNHRHKKDLKAEKAKVKLKQTKTKFLPKGLNVTDTNFKIKAIVLPQQLKEKDSGEALSKRKLNVKDLLSRLKHYNENMRHDACEELSEMIALHTEEIIQQHLQQITLNVSTLMQDREGKVRKTAAKAVSSLLTHVPEEKLQPFLYYFATNLRCAMTNIHRNIQEDSLIFLDCFLASKSGLIKLFSEKLLPDFFTLISKFRSDSALDRTLTVNLGSKLTSVTWRIKVLARLYAILKTILEISETEYHFRGDTQDNVVDGCTSNIFPIYADRMSNALDYSVFNSNGFSQNKNINTIDILNRHIVSLIPLLYETWLEVVPEKQTNKSTGETTMLDEESAALLSCIMNTMRLLYQYVSKYANQNVNIATVFLTKEGRKFLNHLISNFPYNQSGGKAKHMNKLKNGCLKVFEINNDTRCVEENLMICLIYTVLSLQHFQNNIKRDMEAVLAYVTKCLLAKSFESNESLVYLTELIKEFLLKNYLSWKKRGIDVNIVLENTIFFYSHTKMNDEARFEIFSILCRIVDNSSINRSGKYQQWLSSLPTLLCDSRITDKTVKVLLELSKKVDDVFFRSFKYNLPKILDNIDKIDIVLTQETDSNKVRQNIANILYYVPKFSEDDIIYLKSYISENNSSITTLYIQQILEWRSWLKNDVYNNCT